MSLSKKVQCYSHVISLFFVRFCENHIVLCSCMITELTQGHLISTTLDGNQVQPKLSGAFGSLPGPGKM